MSLRAVNVFLSCTLIGCLGYVRAELKSPAPNIDFGIVEASKNLIPLSWTIINDDDKTLRLVCIETTCPNIKTSLEAGVLAPGGSTKVFATFDSRLAVGPINGTLVVIAEHGSVASLTFHGEVKSDIEPKTELKTIISDIGSDHTTVTGKTLVFTTKSGVPFVSYGISISSESFIGAHIAVDNDRVEIIPYIYVPSLPKARYGHTILKVHFKYAIGELIYSVPIIWERKDPLHIIKMSSDTYAVSYDDGCRFKLQRLDVALGTVYKTWWSKDGLTLLIRLKETRVVKATKALVLKGRKYGIGTRKRRIIGNRVNTRCRYSIASARARSSIRLKANSAGKHSSLSV